LQGTQGFGTEVERGDYENRVRLRISHINYANIPAVTGLPESHPGSVAAWAVLERSPENVVNFLLGNIVTMNVRSARFGIDVEAEFHSKHAEEATVGALRQRTDVYKASPRRGRGCKSDARFKVMLCHHIAITISLRAVCS
jgi:hypothetical protein